MRQCFGKYIIAWPALGEPEVALALERLQRAQQHRLAAISLLVAPTHANLGRRAADLEESVERRERRRTNAAVGRQVGIVRAVAVERGERTLEEGDRDRRSHVDARVEELGGDARSAGGDLIEMRPEPV